MSRNKRSRSSAASLTVDTTNMMMASTPGTVSPDSAFTSTLPKSKRSRNKHNTPSVIGTSTPLSIPATTPSPMKSIKRHAEGRWTKEEDGKLKVAVKEMGGKNWKKISQMAFGGVRSDVQCLHRWQKVLRPGLHKGPWSKEEDAIVLEYVKSAGGVNMVKWSAVAHQVKGRLGKQVRERWYNHLDPMLKKGPWSTEEDALLLQLQAKMGNRWCEIAKNIAGRSENAVKNRWNSAQRRARAQKENKHKDGAAVAKKPRKSKKRKAASVGSQSNGGATAHGTPLGNETGQQTIRKKTTTGPKGSGKTSSKARPAKKMKSDPSSGLSVIADIGTALSMCEMVAAHSSSPVQAPTRPATPPTRKNEAAAHVLAHSFVRIKESSKEESKEETAASALLAIF